MFILTTIITIIDRDLENWKKLQEIIFSQLNDKWEIIVIFDSIIDKTKINENKNKNILFLHVDKANVSSNRNIGINNSKGTYVSFVDGDDLISKDYFSIINKNLKCFSPDLLLFSWEKIYPSNEITNFKNKMLETKNHLCCNLQSMESFSKVFRKEIILKNNLFFYEHGSQISEDLFFVTRFCKFAKKITTINEVIYKYCLSYNSITIRSSNTLKLSSTIFYLSILNNDNIFDNKEYAFITINKIFDFFIHNKFKKISKADISNLKKIKLNFKFTDAFTFFSFKYIMKIFSFYLYYYFYKFF